MTDRKIEQARLPDIHILKFGESENEAESSQSCQSIEIAFSEPQGSKEEAKISIQSLSDYESHAYTSPERKKETH